MKTLLILGAIESFCDLILDVRQMGIQTIVCDYYPDAPGKKLGDISYDLSTTDVESMVQVAEKHHVDGVICAFSDRNIPTCYEVAKRLDLPTFYTQKVIETLTDKIKMKAHFKRHGFPILNYKIITDCFTDHDFSDFDFPVIIKPVDSSGSKGVFVCESPEDVRKYFKSCADESVCHRNKIIMEEYYPTDEISITAWVKEGKSYVTCIYDVGKNFDKNVVLSSVIFPSKYTSRTTLPRIEQLVQDLTTSLGIREGPVTVQCFVGDKGLKVSEYIYRLAGGSPYLYTQYMGGPNMAKMLAQFSVGDAIHYGNLEQFTSLGKPTTYTYRIYATQPGQIFYEFDEEQIKNSIPECTYVEFYSQSGTEFTSIPTDGKVIARVYCEVADPGQKSYGSFIEKLETTAIIRDQYGKNITSYNRPDHEVSRYCYELKL